MQSMAWGPALLSPQSIWGNGGHPDDPNVKLALEELAYFTDSIKILGVYPASPLRG